MTKKTATKLDELVEKNKHKAAGEGGLPRWVHPTRQAPRSVTILGLGPTNGHYHAANFHYRPGVPPTDEVWTVNKGIRTQRADLVFVMDDLIGERNKAPAYFDDLMRCGKPIITSSLDAAVRALVPPFVAPLMHEFPLEQVVDYCGSLFLRACERRIDRADDIHAARGEPVSPRYAARLEGNHPGHLTALRDREAGLRNFYYLHNSIPFMLAYALFLETVETVHLFGVDYTYPGSDIREDDRANAEFWVGALRANGVHVKVPEATTLLNARKQPWCYGYGARQPVLE